MKKNIIPLILFVLVFTSSFSQQNPFQLDDLPSSTKFEFMTEQDLYISDYKSEFYYANINSETFFPYIITQNIPDCLIATNQFYGMDIYKKLTKGGYERIVHIRKAGEIFKVFYVNKNNENDKLVITANVSEVQNSITVVKIAYALYWNEIFQ